jgi:hypothetical protein
MGSRLEDGTGERKVDGESEVGDCVYSSAQNRLDMFQFQMEIVETA